MVDLVKCFAEVEDYGVCPGTAFEGAEEVGRGCEQLSDGGVVSSKAVLIVLEPAVLVQVRVEA